MRNNTNLQAVIFDLDGVIVSTDNCHYLAWKQLADEEGIYFDRTINERLRGVSRMESLDILLERSDKSYTDAEKEAMATRKNTNYVKLIQSLTKDDILKGTMSVLEKLKENGIKLAIGSSSKNAPIILRQIGLTDEFDAIADGNHIKNSKPHPEVFLLASSMLGIDAKNCLVVEDADAGIEAAHAASMTALGVGSASENPTAYYHALDLEQVDIDKIIDTFEGGKQL